MPVSIIILFYIMTFWAFIMHDDGGAFFYCCMQ